MIKKSLILLLLLIPLASAELELKDLSQNIYNLGEKIYLNAYTEQTNDIAGILRITINCNDYELNYFMTPLSLEANEEEIIEIPSLEATTSLLGICRVIATLRSNEGEIIETAESSEFEVAKTLNVSFETDKEEYDPGDLLELKIDVRTKYGYDVENPDIDVFLGSKIAEFNESKLRYEIMIPEAISSGEHSLSLQVNDKKGNSGEASKNILIAQIPTKLEYKLNKEAFLPDETIEITPLLYDQADDIVIETTSLIIKDPDNNIVYNNNVESNTLQKYKFDKYALPGYYSILINYESLNNEFSIVMDQYLNLDINLEGETVYIKNIGNIPYDDKKDILVESEEKNYVISRKISIAPGEELIIDLSKELPEGNYEITVPSYDPEIKEFTETILEDVDVHDARSTVKKATDGLSGVTETITGAVVTVGGLLKPSVAALMLIVLIFGLSVYFYLKGKQEE